MTPADLSDIAVLRKAIDAADEMLLKALAHRFRSVELIAKVKRAFKKPIEDKVREDEIKQTWKAHAKKLGIKDEFALLILDLVLHESKTIQSE